MSLTDKPRALLRTRPEDFVVEEIPAYEPSGRGGHGFVTFRKTGLTTMQAVDQIARALDVDPRAAGYAGLKDRHAVTTQTASFPFPEDRDLDAAVAALALEGIEILGVARHGHKLKAGHLRGNRFRIALRDLSSPGLETVVDALQATAVRGVPNRFGPQRFGRDGANPERALRWLGNAEPPPRNRKVQRLLFSAVQALLYNRVLDRRVADGTWCDVIAGDLAKKHDSGGLFLVGPDPAEVAAASTRAAAGEISPTGPMFGAKMRATQGHVHEMEREILAEAGLDEGTLARAKRLGRGTRRSLRLLPTEVAWTTERDHRVLVVSFVLPKGGYATTLLSELCHVTDLARSSSLPASSTHSDGTSTPESASGT